MSLFDHKQIGARFAALRRTTGLTQEKAAEQLLISHSMLAKLERGIKGPSLDTLISAALTFHVSLDYLVFGTKPDDPVPVSPQLIRQLIHTLLQILQDMDACSDPDGTGMP
jgi:transcriptional regulator with XRE-family HTH domain